MHAISLQKKPDLTGKKRKRQHYLQAYTHKYKHTYINILMYVCISDINTHTHKKLYFPHCVCVFYSVCFATSTKVSPVSCCCSRWRWPMTATAINTMQFKRRRCWRRCCRSCVQNTHKRIYRMKIAHTHTRTHTRGREWGRERSHLPALLGHFLCRVALLHSFSTHCLRRCLRLCCCCCVLFFKYVTCLALPVSFCCSEKCCQLFKVCCK